MSGNYLSIGQRVEHWLHTFGKLRRARAGQASHGEVHHIDEGTSIYTAWKILAEGFRRDRLNATREFLARQHYYKTIQHNDTGEWIRTEEVDIPPSLDLDELYLRLDSSASINTIVAEGLALTLVIIDENGTPREASIHQSDHLLLNTKALYTAMRTRFAPAYRYDIPVATMVLMPLYFRAQ